MGHSPPFCYLAPVRDARCLLKECKWFVTYATVLLQLHDWLWYLGAALSASDWCSWQMECQWVVCLQADESHRVHQRCYDSAVCIPESWFKLQALCYLPWQSLLKCCLLLLLWVNLGDCLVHVMSDSHSNEGTLTFLKYCVLSDIMSPALSQANYVHDRHTVWFMVVYGFIPCTFMFMTEWVSGATILYLVHFIG